MREEEFLKDEIVELSIEPLMIDFSEILKIYAQAGEYAVTSHQWYQLNNILRSWWNIINYYIITPVEIESTASYKEILLMAEQLLKLLDHYNESTQINDSEGNQ